MESLVGYRFKPKDEEIITLLNKKKIDPDFSVQTINEVDIYNFEPSDLSRLSAIQSDELVWYFFCSPYYKYGNSKRANRRTNMGYWKLTGRGCKIYAKHGKEVIGCKRFLTFCEDGSASKRHKAEWVMHEFRSQYNSPHTTDFVICRIERKTQNKPKISTDDDGQSCHHLASNFRNHVAENNLLRVETQQLCSHLHMTYDFRNHVAENGLLAVESQLPSHHLQFDSRNHVTEKTIQGEELQLLPNQLLTSTSINRVVEKIFSGVEYQPPSQYLTSGCGNHGAEKTLPRVDCQQLPSHYFNSTFDYRNHVAENIFPMDESQLLPSHHSVSHSRNHVAENNYPQVPSQQLPSHYTMSDFKNQVGEHSFSGGESMVFAQYSDRVNYNSLPALQSPIHVEDDGFSGCNGLDHYSFTAQQSPINPEWGLSSYSDGFSDCSVLNFQFVDRQEEMSLQLTVRDECPLEEIGRTIAPGFSSSKSLTEVHFGDSSGTG